MNNTFFRGSITDWEEFNKFFCKNYTKNKIEYTTYLVLCSVWKKIKTDETVDNQEMKRMSSFQFFKMLEAAADMGALPEFINLLINNESSKENHSPNAEAEEKRKQLLNKMDVLVGLVMRHLNGAASNTELENFCMSWLGHERYLLLKLKAGYDLTEDDRDDLSEILNKVILINQKKEDAMKKA